MKGFTHYLWTQGWAVVKTLKKILLFCVCVCRVKEGRVGYWNEYYCCHFKEEHRSLSMGNCTCLVKWSIAVINTVLHWWLTQPTLSEFLNYIVTYAELYIFILLIFLVLLFILGFFFQWFTNLVSAVLVKRFNFFLADS